MNNLAKIVLSITISLLLGIFIFCNLTYDGLIVKIFGIGILEIQSGSMEDELDIGDVIIIKECEEYQINDIVTFKVDNKYLVTHRIVKQSGNSFFTKGDNNNTIDNGNITKNLIEGKVIYNSKLLKFIYNYKIIIVLVIFLILIIFNK